MDIKKIVMMDLYNPIEERHVESVKQTLPGVEVFLARNDKDLEALDDADAVLVWPHPTRKLVEFCVNAPSLKWVHAFTSGLETVMNSEIGKLNIKISSTKGDMGGIPISDHVLAYMFALSRLFPAFYRFQMDREYVKMGDRDGISYTLGEITDKTVGIISLGEIGTHIARKCKALGMRVLATKRRPVESEYVDVCYPASEIDTLLKESDYVVLILPLTKETEKMIGERELRLMKKSAYLINVARGGIVDEEALIKVLQEGTIAGAGLDVFTTEFTADPLPKNSPFWDLPNVIITPHLAAQSEYYNDRAFKVINENLRRISKDKELLFEVDRSLYK